MSINNLVSIITSAGNSRADHLLQHLYEIQYQYSFIPDQAVKFLAERLSLTEAHINGVIGF